jgi:type I restriction enzyme M protein
MVGNKSAEIGFEKKIWEAVRVLRGAIDVAEYKHIVLGLIFLKRLSDVFEEQYNALTEEGRGFEENREVYAEKRVFYVPAKARWETIAAGAHSSGIGKMIDEAVGEIERENKALEGVFPRNFARPELDKGRLGEAVELFTGGSARTHRSGTDMLERAYEYCLDKFAEEESRTNGDFYTPACVVKTLVEVVQPCNGRVYDPCCGSGGMFIRSARFAEGRGGRLSVFGQEADSAAWKLCRMNLAVRGIEADLGGAAADVFCTDLHKTENMDFILANPPFTLSGWGADKPQTDPRWKYGIPPAGNADFAWLQHMIFHLNERGRLGAVLANRSLSNRSGGEGAIRRGIIEDDLVECIIALPAQLFYTAQMPVSLWFLNKKKQQKGRTLFIDARGRGAMLSRRRRVLTDADIAGIADVAERFREGRLKPEKGFCAVASIEEIAKQDFILTPGRYTGVAGETGGDEPFEEKMTRLTGELFGLFTESHRLEREIKQRLAAVGWDA